MVDPNVLITVSDLRKVDWPSAVAEADEKECYQYASLFVRKMREAESAEEQTGFSVYRLLSQITSLQLRHESTTEPYGPISVIEGYRSSIIEDFSGEQLKVLEEIVSEIVDAELRARIADVIWFRLKNYRAALLAIDAYLESASNLEDPEHWTQTHERIERALRLAASLGKGGKAPFEKVISNIEETLHKYNGEDPLFLSCKLMELLLEFNQGEPVFYAAIAEKAARRAEGDGAWHRARTYWEAMAKWHEKANAKEDAIVARVCVAETYVSEAVSATSSLAAATHMQHAIEAYRRLGGQQARVAALHNQLLEYQQKSAAEMTAFSTQYNASEAMKHAIEAVSGKPLHEAIMALCLLVRPIRVSELRRQVEELVEKHPLQFLVSAVVVDSEGKVVARMPDMLTDDEMERQKAFHAYMVRQTDFHYTVEVQAAIEPARRQILLEQNVTLSEIMPFVSNNPLIRPGREYLYAEGLRCGFIGDWVVAAHLLIPQFEESMRYLLQSIGITTSGLDEEGIQDERSLNTTLYIPEIEQALGPDISFDLQSLLVERYGHNLRNNLAHGLMSHGAFYSHSVIYLWWLILRLICWPAIVEAVKRKVTSSEEDVQPGREE